MFSTDINNFMEKSFLEYLSEEDIANNEIYLSNMAKSFGDKAWFLKLIPDFIDTIVDFGGGEGEFCEFLETRARSLGRSFKYIVVDNNKSFLDNAVKKGFRGLESLDALARDTSWNPDTTLLNMSSVIHEVYSYADERNTVEDFWNAISNCAFKMISIRDMSLGRGSYSQVPKEAVFYIYDNVFKSPKYIERLESFEDVWGSICSDEGDKHRLLDVKRLIHFLIKYRYVENWNREVQENYLPLTQDKLQDWIVNKLGYKLIHKESSKLPFYHKCWTKDFKLNLPDNNGYRQQFAEWLKSITTHIKWLASR